MRTQWLLPSLATISACLALSACNTDPGKDSSHAQVSEPATAAVPPAAPAAAPATPAGGDTYAFSGADSKVAFVGAKVTKKHDGGFKNFNGSVQLIAGDPTKSSVTVEIETASIFIDNPKLEEHLKSPDFFDVAKFPRARFTSTAIKSGGEAGATHTITGNLELHGVSKTITFPATIRPRSDRVEVDSEFSINRKDWNIVYPGMPDDLIQDNVLIKLTLRANRSPQA